MAVAYEQRRFTVDEFSRMAEIGVIGPDERVELLDGEIITMAPIGAPHGGDVDRLAHMLIGRFGTRAVVRIQGPVRLLGESLVVPDATLLRRRDDFYRARLPEPPNVLAVIEVAESSLAYDRGKKRQAYARSGIPEYWLFDLVHGTLTIFRDPSEGDYASQRAMAIDETIRFLAFPDDEFRVSEWLPW